MNWLEHSHEIVAALVVGTWFAGLAFLVLGKRARDLDWVAFSVLTLFSIGIAIDLFFVDGTLGSQQKIWARGWIGPRDQPGAITIGMIEDTLGLTVALCAAAIGALYSLNRWLVRREPLSERALAGLLMSVAGVAVAWLSLTPWLSILGLTLTTFGGVILLDANSEPDLIARFGSERAWGFILSFLGAAVLAGSRHALLLQQGFPFAASGLPNAFDWIGGLLLVTGLYLHIQPFPFLGWLSREPKVSPAASAIVGQLLPALACFGIMIRFEPELRSIGVFNVFGWVAIGSALLASICGLAQPGWKTALPLWLSSSLTFAFAALCFSGGPAALAILLGTVLSGSALAIVASGRASGRASDGSGNGGAARWMKSLLFAILAPGMGLVGFIGSGGLVRLMSRGAADPAMATLLTLALISCNLLLWKTLFSILSVVQQSAEKPGSAPEGDRSAWLCLLSGWALVALSLGILWTGALTGGALPGDPDRIFASWLAEMFGAHATAWDSDALFSAAGLAQGLYWIGVLFPIPLSFWLFGRKQDVVIKSLGNSPRLRNFLESGYSADRLGVALERALRRCGAFLEKWISQKISTEWLPSWVERAVHAPARWINEADRRVYLREEELIRRWTEVPAKALQLIQNGDVQWYLLFAIGSIVAILVHFRGYIP